MRASTLLPWTFFGPLLLGVASQAMFHLTGGRAWERVAQGCAVWLIVWVGALFVMNWRYVQAKRGRDRSQLGEAPHDDSQGPA